MITRNLLNHKWPFDGKKLLLTVLSIALGLLVGGLALAFAGYNPFEAYGIIFTGLVRTPKDISFTIIRSTPLILTGLSVAFAFRTGLFNIGAEGQFIVGSLAAALTGIFLPLPPLLHIPLTLMAALLAGFLWGALAGWLKARFGVHEVIATIMLNWIALYLNNFVVGLETVVRPMSEASRKIADSARIDLLGVWKISEEGQAFRRDHPFWDDLFRSPLNFGVFIALALVVLVGFVLKKTTLGFELKAVGHNKDAAELSGIPLGKSLVLSLGIAGALAGAAGALQVMGVTREVSKLAAMEGNGFDGIAVALIGGSTPLGSVLAAFFFGALKYAGPKIQPALGAPLEIVNIVMGSIIFFVAMPRLFGLITKQFQNKASQRKKLKSEVKSDG